MKRLCCNVLAPIVLIIAAANAGAQRGQLAWAIHYDPKTFDPAMVEDEASETVRVLTGGVLVRVDRRTLNAVPQLAESWDISKDGETIRFHLRAGLAFSNGAPLTSADVARTLEHILDPKTSSPKASLFPRGTAVTTPDARTVIVRAPSRIDSPDWAFDEISIEPGGRGEDERVTAGPFFVVRYVQGQFVALLAERLSPRGHHPPRYSCQSRRGDDAPAARPIPIRRSDPARRRERSLPPCRGPCA